MKNSLLLGLGRLMIPIPRFIWQRQVRGSARRTRARLASLPDEHTVIHYFCVTELPRAGEPLSPETIAQKLYWPVDRVTGAPDGPGRADDLSLSQRRGSRSLGLPGHDRRDAAPDHV